MNSLLSQFQQRLDTLYPDKSEPLSDTARLAMLKAVLPLCQHIPHPASGQTLLRWQLLSHVAGLDLTVAKWLESHLDALTIFHELGYDTWVNTTSDKLWAVWAAEGHPTPVTFYPQAIDADTDIDNKQASELTASLPMQTMGVCNGVKTWCSGANLVAYGLMTYRDDANQSQLLIVDMSKQGIRIDNRSWQAVGMQATDTATLYFDDTPAIAIGGGNAYLERAGFWHGAAGVAACWYGATIAIARYLLTSYQQKTQPFKAMYLGEISSRLSLLQHYFNNVATQIDKQPHDNHVLIIRQLRYEVQAAATLIMTKVGEALGAAPFCQNPHFARLSADLTVFIRQSHGAFDAQAVGEQVAKSFDDFDNSDNAISDKENPWQL